MKACGLIVEYNPFHNGHLHHLEHAKQIADADCLIAIMSGPFLQRGEPAIIDKFHRARAALFAGADIVVELPYPYAVQSSELFAKGALLSLHELGASSICFGSESGDIGHFLTSIAHLQENKSLYDKSIQTYLKEGLAYPEASGKAYEEIGLADMDLVQPNNILGFSYVKTIKKYRLPIEPLTIPRIQNKFHDEEISTTIASATSIRKELENNELTGKARAALPEMSASQLVKYKKIAGLWHRWDHYFPFLQYRVLSMEACELKNIHGVDEGLENRIKRTAAKAVSFADWIDSVKTRRYTQARLQRTFTHILLHSSKEAIASFTGMDTVPYIRLLGLSKTGQAHLNRIKQHVSVPIIANLSRKFAETVALDEKAANVYYSVLPPEARNKLRKQEFRLPIHSR